VPTKTTHLHPPTTPPTNRYGNQAQAPKPITTSGHRRLHSSDATPSPPPITDDSSQSFGLTKEQQAKQQAEQAALEKALFGQPMGLAKLQPAHAAHGPPPTARSSPGAKATAASAAADYVARGVGSSPGAKVAAAAAVAALEAEEAPKTAAPKHPALAHRKLIEGTGGSKTAVIREGAAQQQSTRGSQPLYGVTYSWRRCVVRSGLCAVEVLEGHHRSARQRPALIQARLLKAPAAPTLALPNQSRISHLSTTQLPRPLLRQGRRL